MSALTTDIRRFGVEQIVGFAGQNPVDIIIVGTAQQINSDTSSRAAS